MSCFGDKCCLPKTAIHNKRMQRKWNQGAQNWQGRQGVTSLFLYRGPTPLPLYTPCTTNGQRAPFIYPRAKLF